MEQQHSSDQRTPKRRRWWQFTLRSLLVLMLLLALPLAWMGNELACRRREQDLADAIKRAGGTVLWRSADGLSFPWGHEEDPFGPDHSWTHSSRIAEATITAETKVEFQLLLSRVKDLQYLTALNLSDTPVSDADLQGLERLSKLARLDLAGTNVGDETISTLLKLPALTTLNIEYSDITDSGLEILAGLPSLEELDVTGTRITEIAIAKLSRDRPGIRLHWEGSLSSQEQVRAARGLRRMGWSVYFVDKKGPLGVNIPERHEPISSEELSCLQSIKKLHLTVPERAPRDVHVELPHLAGLEMLQSNGGMDASALRRIAQCPNLHLLVLWDHSLTDADMVILPTFPRLDAIALDATTLTARGLENIASVKKLEFLQLNRAHFLKESLTALQDIPSLEQLILKGCQFDPGATEPLGRLKMLRILDVSGSNLDDAALLPLLSVPVLEELDVGNTSITDRGLARLAEIKSLKTLGIYWLDNVTDEGRKQFSKRRPDVKLAPH